MSEAGQASGATNTFREIGRLRIERNVRSLETLALARVADGMEALAASEADKASGYFASTSSCTHRAPARHSAHVGDSSTSRRGRFTSPLNAA